MWAMFLIFIVIISQQVIDFKKKIQNRPNFEQI